MLTNKVAIVTGAGRGIGAEIAKSLAGAGAKVAVNDLNPDRAERVAAQIRSLGGQALGLAGDVSNKFQCVNVVEATRREWGHLDILVNNAVVKPAVSILKMDEWDWERCLAVNLKGTFFMCQLCGRVMAEENRERGGVIVNIGAAVGDEKPMSHSAYYASKAGVVRFSRECAREFAQYGIRVNAVLPGVFPPKTTQPEVRPAQPFACWPEETPMTRLARPAEVADLVVYLCSESGSHLSGHCLAIDGDQATT